MNCQVVGCDQPAKWKVSVVFWAIGADKAKADPARAELPIGVCHGHKDTPPHAAPELFTAEGRTQITLALVSNGNLPPDFETAEWRYDPIGEDL